MAKVNSREAPILKGAIQLLKLRGFACWRTNAGCLPNAKGRPVRMLPAGFADLLSVVPKSGRMLVCECKRPGGRPTATQEAFLAAVRAAGGVALVVDDLARLDFVLTRLRAEPWLGLDAGGYEA